MLGRSEPVIFILLLVSLITLEFLRERPKPFLLTGSRVLDPRQAARGVPDQRRRPIFVYAGAAVALIGLVLHMPPYRPRNWISGDRR